MYEQSRKKQVKSLMQRTKDDDQVVIEDDFLVEEYDSEAEVTHKPIHTDWQPKIIYASRTVG